MCCIESILFLNKVNMCVLSNINREPIYSSILDYCGMWIFLIIGNCFIYIHVLLTNAFIKILWICKDAICGGGGYLDLFKSRHGNLREKIQICT